MFSRRSNLSTFYLRLYSSLTSGAPFLLLFFTLYRDAVFDLLDSSAVEWSQRVTKFMYRSMKAAILLNQC